jgi:hypothetical protein
MYNLSELKIQSLLHNYSVYIIYHIFDISLSSPSTIRIIKSRRMRWGRREMCIGYSWESQRE